LLLTFGLFSGRQRGLQAILAAMACPNEVSRMANPRIFNHDIMGCTAEGVTGNHLYSGRALGATEPGDLIQLHPALQPQWPHIQAHYSRVGLPHTDRVVWDVGHQPLARHRDHAVSVFFFGSSEQAARPDDRWYRVVDYINSKNRFMALADRLGVPVPRTLCFDGVEQIDAQAIDTAPFPCYLKAAVSVSGVGIYRCADTTALREALQRFSHGIPVQIQAEVVSDSFLNLQYAVTDAGLRRLVATEQVLDGFVHQGNRCPAAHAPWDVIEPMARWLFDEGMQGVFAFDVAVVDRPDGPEFVAIECNPRYNGASYPTAVAERLDIAHWLARSFQTRHRSLDQLDLAGLEYDKATGEGVILINWGPILVGKLLALLAGPPERQDALAAALEGRL
jgi:hypothetical protein